MLDEHAEVIPKDKLYRCLDKLLEHKKELFSFLTNPHPRKQEQRTMKVLFREDFHINPHPRKREQRTMKVLFREDFHIKRWENLFNASFDILLYDLTSTYFECEPPEHGKRKFGYSRDKRSDCVQVVIALIVTPDGLPLAYEVLAGNTSDKTTLADFLKSIEDQYGQANRTWVMDRGIPTEGTLQIMRDGPQPIHYLVGTPRGRLTKLEKSFLSQALAAGS